MNGPFSLYKNLGKKMSKRIARLWVKALESGHYQQTNSTLCHKDGGKFSYCCLGVLARVQGYKFKYNSGEYEPWHKGKQVGDTCLLTDGFAAGLTMEDQNNFAGMNDTRNMNFKQIAREIRIHILGQKGKKKVE